MSPINHDEPDLNLPGIDKILQNRFHGAINIKAIRYQLLYSIFRTLDLYNRKSEDFFIRLEGLEDVDLLSLNINETEYIQVKTSKKSWNWSKLMEPLKNFIEVYRYNKQAFFILVVNFDLKGDYKKLNELDNLNSKEKRRLINKFKKICIRSGATEIEANEIINKIKLIQINEEEIINELRAEVIQAFDLGSEIVDIYILAILGQFLEYASKRKTLKRKDISKLQINIPIDIEKEKVYQAEARNYIEPISWKVDDTLEDFYEGKGVRPGHISAGIDIKRKNWLEKIDKALVALKICIIRAPSGQGKSSLLYRYAYENFKEDETFILNSAKTEKEVQLINAYIDFRARLNLPTILLIDNAGFKLKYWFLIAQKCASLGIRVLITVRNEDWNRYAYRSLVNYEIIEPILELDEAIYIFNALKKNKKVHKSVTSPEWAYEKIEEPKLLMEYIYLITKGRMLYDLLADQIKQFQELKEDPKKSELLRIICLADTVSVPISMEKLLKKIKLRDDPQSVLNSLEGEFIHIRDGSIEGLHKVRSIHTVEILHENYINPYNTALEIIDTLSTENIESFISGMKSIEEIDFNSFLLNLPEKVKDKDLEFTSNILVGIFNLGENIYFKENIHIFDEAFEKIGTDGAVLLSSDHLPFLDQGFFNKLSKIPVFKNNPIFGLSKKFSKGKRGIDYTRDFLEKILPEVKIKIEDVDIKNLGRVLDWLFLCGINIELNNYEINKLLNPEKIFNLGINDFVFLLQGLYRSETDVYYSFFDNNKTDIIDYLRLNTDCISIILDKKNVSIEYFQFIGEIKEANAKVVENLNKMRSAFPFCERYKSKGIWITPFSLTPSIDPTIKDIPVENLHMESDVLKNVIWRGNIEKHYELDSYYNYEDYWYRFRKKCLKYAEILSKDILALMKGLKRPSSPKEVYYDLISMINKVPNPTSNIKKNLEEKLKELEPKMWVKDFQNFINSFTNYIKNIDTRLGHLAVHNLASFLDNLQKMQKFFDKLFEFAPDYFESVKLNELEKATYDKLFDYIEYFINNRSLLPDPNVEKSIEDKKEFERDNLISELRKFGDILLKEEVQLILPNNKIINGNLTYLPIAYNVKNPAIPDEFLIIMKNIEIIKDLVDYFLFIPVYRGRRFMDSYYFISSSEVKNYIEKGNFDKWETSVPISREYIDFSEVLPELPFKPITEFELVKDFFNCVTLLDLLVLINGLIQPIKIEKNRFSGQIYDKYWKKQKINENDLKNRFSSLVDEIKLLPNWQGKILWREIVDISESVLTNMDTIYSFIKDNKIDINKFEKLLDTEFINHYE